MPSFNLNKNCIFWHLMLNVRDWDATMSKPKNNHRVIYNRNVLHLIIQIGVSPIFFIPNIFS